MAYVYLEREVDQQLEEAARRWLESKARTRWISLVTEPGRGNTCLLQHFERQLANNVAFTPGFRCINVEGKAAAPGNPPQRFDPLRAELYRLSRASRLSPLRRLRRRMRHAGFWRLCRLGLSFLIAIAVASVLIGLCQYATTIVWEPAHTSAQLRDFLRTYLPRRWSNFPIWLALATASSLSFSYLVRNRLLPEPERAHEPSEDEIKEYQTPTGALELLAEICRGDRGVILLIDDLQWLPDSVINCLNQLLSATEINLPTRTLNVLIVAVETQAIELPAATESLTVPPFDLTQLRSILHRQVDRGSLPSEETDFLTSAQGNVKALLAFRQRELIDRVGVEFKLARQDVASVFGLARLMTYQAVRQLPAVSLSQLLHWLESLAREGHLAAFDLRAPERPQALLKKFSRSCLVRSHRFDECILDPESCTALVLWLQTHAPVLLAEARYYWTVAYASQVNGAHIEPAGVGQLAEAERHAIKVAAWHATRLGEVLERASDVLVQASGLSTPEREAICERTSTLLLTAAAIWRSEADLGEAEDLILDTTAEWLPAAGEATMYRLQRMAVDQLWRGFWRNGNAKTRGRIEGLVASFSPTLFSEDRYSRRFEELLQGGEALAISPPRFEFPNPSFLNLDRLTETLLAIRQTHGFREPALADAALTIHESVPGGDDAIFELALLELGAAARRERGELTAWQAANAQWRKRLEETQPAESRLGDEAWHLLARARYMHELTGAWSSSFKDDTGEEWLESERVTTLRRSCLEEPADDVDLPDHLWRTAKALYQKSLRLALLLGWQPLILEASLGLALLLERHTPEELRSPEATWWEPWDALLNSCIDTETSLGWSFYRPGIHKIRYDFFKRTREYSLDDAYNVFISLKTARYPNRIILEWHQLLSSLLNNYGESENHRRRSAELNEIWAHELAPLPEAHALWKFKCLGHEQAYYLNFAAQGLRLAGDLKRSDNLLDDADRVLAALGVPSESEEEGAKHRELQISLRLQRAWLRKAQERSEEYTQLVQELWREIKRGDEDAVLLLDSLASIEFASGILEGSWPPHAQGEPLADPENDNLSLPSSHFEGNIGELMQNRFMFRFHQLLSLAMIDANADQFKLGLLAHVHWLGLEQSFGKTVLHFAKIGTEITLNSTARSLIIRVLEAVEMYFASVEEVHRHALEALLLLMQYDQNNMHYRGRYAIALLEHQHLLKHELAAQKASDHPNWLTIVLQVDRYLRVLVSEELQMEWLTASMRGTGWTFEQLVSTHQERQEALEKARASLANGDLETSKRLLAAVLPSDRPPWVFLEDLKTLDLWLRCLQGSASATGEEAAARYEQLHRLALRYVRQLAGSIREEQVQRLAIDLLEIEETVAA